LIGIRVNQNEIFIIIPVHNEAGHVGKVLGTLKKYNLPIVVVDDGSEDNSKLKIQNLKLENSRFWSME